ncbi:MAG: hypothetical protein COW00_02545 [Bdellovibrio sp. CG12_big_fil_rev_8_21_14_0_65_39_13]|nr:MAG: hypothetical protein COW78_03570 [Bdellovibrio sp. CG22_combo_CG10-13_8_21_14_all_39_27]PIQ62017.1 MAG: hypothetical protein COW00_02545 [Bdellovibrio sp. CG12_big_fil_rev_8_21_14_0_65_39_13]PIR34115.1 MAG: hypothetical protein COV37_14300 [Bdellovibrio sp. CG11_big_fil_rev_8_21_14_0_20_39_38]PJB52998.1 MAG: hypothetical protein CO099_09575 [Bdellovibrio sp. CG_4_9_14_3_um_filter_39_7]
MSLRIILLLFLLFTSSCGQRVAKYLGPSSNIEMIDTDADEDGDGLSNSLELKRNFDRSEFNFPRLKLSQTKMELKVDFQSTLFETSKQDFTDYHILPSPALPQQYLLLPQMSTQERWMLEQQAWKESILQLEMEGFLSWDLNDLLTFQSAKIDLGIYDWSTAQVHPLDSYLVVNQISQGQYHWTFTLSEEDKDKVKNRKMKWDFVLVLSDSEWKTPQKSIYWHEAKENYAHFIVSNTMNPKLFSLKVNPHIFISPHSGIELYENEKLVRGIPIIEKGVVYHQQNTEFAYEKRNLKKQTLLKYQMDVKDFRLRGLGGHSWERIDLTLLSSELKPHLVSREVDVVWVGQKPCEVGGGRIQKGLCEGQSIVRKCSASYQMLTSQPQEKLIPIDKINVQLENSTMSLRGWTKISGAEILNEGKLIRWEGNSLSAINMRPLKLIWHHESQNISYGYVGIQCPPLSSPAIPIFSHDQSQHSQKEQWSFSIEQFQF